MELLGTQLLIHYPPPKSITFLQKLKVTIPSSKFHVVSSHHTAKPVIQLSPRSILMGAAGITLISLLSVGVGVGPSNAIAADLTEPSNALSLPTWAIHVSSVVEWVTAMALVWQYGGKTGLESWKGLSWGMVVPLLGGALCACTWHFFYNSESLEVLVVLQAALTVIGNATMCIAAYRIYTSSQEQSDNL